MGIILLLERRSITRHKSLIERGINTILQTPKSPAFEKFESKLGEFAFLKSNGDNHWNERERDNITAQCIATNANFLAGDKIEFARQRNEINIAGIVPVSCICFPLRASNNRRPRVSRVSQRRKRMNEAREEGENEQFSFERVRWFIALIKISGLYNFENGFTAENFRRIDRAKGTRGNPHFAVNARGERSYRGKSITVTNRTAARVFETVSQN